MKKLNFVDIKQSKTIGIAKMDARESKEYVLLGESWVVSRVAKMDAINILRKFIEMSGRVVYDENNCKIKIRKRAHTPV